MNGQILYQGHGSLRITTKDGVVIYVDPYAGNGYDEPADLILVTHQHFDHNQIDKPAQKPGCEIWQNFDMLQNGEYAHKNFGDIDIETVEAYNKSHPKDECVGYILKFDGITVYVAGDTAETDKMHELKDYDIDYAFLPVDPMFTMDVDEAEKCAELIGAKHVIPYHMKPGGLFSKRTAKKFGAENKLVLKPGEKISY